ncbi:MAG: hypothetical protein methR_P2916 [Methyloprofundus sp.]|nr:MAG: hypothetical protein methR_P2916 [Methyloprofundus sp.]
MQEQFITDKSGRKISVILPIQEYEALLDDLKDLATIAELKDSPTVSLDDVIRKLKNSNLL